jgi:hypothetical protein
LELFSQLKAFSWLSNSDKFHLTSALEIANFTKREVILRESELASAAHILLAGAARLTCLNVRTDRVVVALLPPGPIPEFPKLPFTPSRFQIEAYDDCRVGSLAWSSSTALHPIPRVRPSGNFTKVISNNGIDYCCGVPAS